MKASELMTGNWVMPLLKKCNGIPGRVITIDAGTNTCWIDSNEYSCLISCSDIEPIPLTPEILEKNGFKPFKVNENESVEVIGKWWGMMGLILVKQFSLHVGKVFSVKCNHSRIANVRNAHEFQNALRICGIEKEIKL